MTRFAFGRRRLPAREPGRAWLRAHRHELQMAALLTIMVVLPSAGPFVERLSRLEIPVHVVDLGRLVAPAAVVRLAVTLHRLTPDIVQSHGARSNFYARLAVALLPRPRHVSTVHNSLRDSPVSTLRRIVYRAMDRSTRFGNRFSRVRRWTCA